MDVVSLRWLRWTCENECTEDLKHGWLSEVKWSAAYVRAGADDAGGKEAPHWPGVA